MNSGSLYKVYNTLNDLSIANKMQAKIIGFKNFGDRILDNDISCFETYNQDFNSIISDKFFAHRPPILLHDQEPVMYKQQKSRWDKWRFYTSTFDNRMIILHSEKNSQDLDDLCNDLNAIPCHWFSNGALAFEWFAVARWNLRLYMNRKDSPRLHYKFSCLNRLISHQRIYRPVFSKLLMDIVNHDHLRLSCSMIDPSDRTNVNCLDLPQKYKKLFTEFDCNNPILININEQDTSDGNQEILNWAPNPNSDYFTSVFCHIATETLFMDNTLHLTEKSLRAFVNKRPMLLLGPPHSLDYLRSYGFETWGDFWDESYDEIEDPWERMEAVLKIVKKLNTLTLDDMEKMLDRMQPILEHNFHHFMNDFPKVIVNELMTNMTSAIYHAKVKEPNGWMMNRIEQLSEDYIKNLLNTPLTNEFPNDELYRDYKLGDMTKIDHNLARVLLLEMGFDKESSKEDILARLKIIFD